MDIHAERPLKNHSIYSIAKAGNAMMVKALARELGPGVRVNGIAPGAILWPEEDPGDETKDVILARTALKRAGSPEDIARAVAGWAAPTVLCAPDERWDAFAASRAALAASGTVTLELARAGLPMVVAYRVGFFTTLAALLMVRTKMIGLVNILLDRKAVPEMLLRDCRPEPLAREVARLLEDGPGRRDQLSAFAEIDGMFEHIGAPPSERAAEAILDLLAARSGRPVDGGSA